MEPAAVLHVPRRSTTSPAPLPARQSTRGSSPPPPAHPVTLVLRLVSVDGQRGPAVHAQLAGHRIATLLGFTEDQDAAAVHLLRGGHTAGSEVRCSAAEDR